MVTAELWARTSRHGRVPLAALPAPALSLLATAGFSYRHAREHPISTRAGRTAAAENAVPVHLSLRGTLSVVVPGHGGVRDDQLHLRHPRSLRHRTGDQGRYCCA